MKQFDVVTNRAQGALQFASHLVILTSHLIDLVIVAPLLIDVSREIQRLDVSIQFRGASHILAVTELASLPPERLGRSLGSVADQEDPIRRAIDRLFTGFDYSSSRATASILKPSRSSAKAP